jgi:hypothetical protein
MRRVFLVGVACASLLARAGTAQTADHPWQINSKEGGASVALGFLAQGQAEVVRAESATGGCQNLYLRRFRLMAGGKLMEKLSFFIETDSPNLGKGSPAGAKGEERIFFQDIILTYTFRPEFQLDAGLLLVAASYNGGQGATTLLPVDYAPYSFLSSEPTGSRSGRDYGMQARGYLAHDHFEYRMGVYQGYRNPGSTNSFRYSGRFVWYPFEAETGFFYTGTTLGKRKILALGAGFDVQRDYSAKSVDLFWDRPLPGGDGLTLQAGYTRYDGGRIFPQLPAENVWLVEAGYYNRGTRLGPFAQLSGRRFDNPALPDTSKYQGGLAYWASGHRLNLKLGVGRLYGAPGADSWQVVLQGQVYVY